MDRVGAVLTVLLLSMVLAAPGAAADQVFRTSDGRFSFSVGSDWVAVPVALAERALADATKGDGASVPDGHFAFAFRRRGKVDRSRPFRILVQYFTAPTSVDTPKDFVKTFAATVEKANRLVHTERTGVEAHPEPPHYDEARHVVTYQIHYSRRETTGTARWSDRAAVFFGRNRVVFLHLSAPEDKAPQVGPEFDAIVSSAAFSPAYADLPASMGGR